MWYFKVVGWYVRIVVWYFKVDGWHLGSLFDIFQSFSSNPDQFAPIKIR